MPSIANEAKSIIPAFKAALKSVALIAAKSNDCPVDCKCAPNPSMDADWLFIVPFPSSSVLK